MFNTYLIQPNFVSFFGDKKNYWIPYSVGVLWSYAVKHKDISDNFALTKLVFSREDVEALSDSILPNSIIVLSCYIWNWEYNKTLAEKIKSKNPSCYIIAGGPQITNRPLENGFFKQHPYIDTIILGEGEISFTDCLRNFLAGKKQKIYLTQRVEDLNLPSPYLTGVFDQIIRENPDCIWNTTLETNRGCPFACTFCDWGSLTYAKVKKFPESKIYAEIEWMAKNGVEYVVFGDANFGIFKQRDYDIAAKICEVKSKYGFPKNLGINWNKNSTAELLPIIKLFTDAGLSRGMTISFQSLNEDTLEQIKRKNMEISNAEEIFKLLEQNNVGYYTELILGLPLESLDSWIESHYSLMDMGQHQCLDVWMTMLLENSELNQPEQKKKFNIKSTTIYNFLRSGYGFDNQIQEKSETVRSTSTMSESDMIKAYLFSWVIINLHYSGWTQIYARFFRIQYNLSYKDFYNNLHNVIASGRLGPLSDLYREFAANIELYLDNYKQFADKNHDNLSAHDFMESQVKMHQQQPTIHALLAAYVAEQYQSYDEDILDNLVEYQKHFTASYDKQYPYVVDLDVGIRNTVYDEIPYQTQLENCVIDTSGKFYNQEDFLNKIMTWKRRGWGKTVITTAK